MAYAREVLLQGSTIACEHVTLLDAAPGWSDEYRVAGSRLVLTLQGPLACRVEREEWRCDPAVGLWLSPETPYRMLRPLGGQCSLVIAVPGLPVRAGRVGISPRVMLALRNWRRRAAMLETMAAEEALVDALAALLPAGSCWGRHHGAVERALDFLAAHYARGETLAQIGAAVACSPFHLARSFRRMTGQSLHAHRTRLRIAEALRRLEAGDTNLSALALDLGFASHSHFTQVFRAHCGARPAEVRTNLAAGGGAARDTAQPWLHPSPASSPAPHRP